MSQRHIDMRKEKTFNVGFLKPIILSHQKNLQAYEFPEDEIPGNTTTMFAHAQSMPSFLCARYLGAGCE